MLFKLTPTLIIDGDVTGIDLEALWQEQIRGFIFDLDNTLIAPHTCELRPGVSDWLVRKREIGFKSVVLTNNKRLEYCQQACQLIDMPFIHHAAKPAVAKFHEALKLLDLPVSQVAVVGDRPLTDIWGGVSLGAYTILVDPLTKLTEPPMIKVLRRLERTFIQSPNHQVR